MILSSSTYIGLSLLLVCRDIQFRCPREVLPTQGLQLSRSHIYLKHRTMSGYLSPLKLISDTPKNILRCMSYSLTKKTVDTAEFALTFTQDITGVISYNLTSTSRKKMVQRYSGVRQSHTTELSHCCSGPVNLI